MTEPPKADLSKLPDWARAAFEAALRRPPTLAEQALEQRQSSVWPMLAHAAVLPQFEPEQIAELSAESPEDQRRLLNFAEAERGIGGFNWTLQRDVRSAVLRSAAESGQLRDILQQSIERFHNPVTVQLRDCMEGTAQITPATDLATLESMRVAVNLLTSVPRVAPAMPSLERVDREINLRRLLSQFERMTDFDPKRSTQQKDRFFGRQEDMRRLRAYVDAIESQGFLEGVGRAVQRARRLVADVRPLGVCGIGGVGKTTLMAQFMLQHAHGALHGDKFPFAYLDFDRPTVSARDPIALLLDIILQVGAQFPDIGSQTLRLRTTLRREARRAQRSEERLVNLVQSYVGDFAATMGPHLSSTRPFLLVFDTFELVQYTRSDVELLEAFVRGFDASASGLWPRMRLVISGRKRLDRFLVDLDERDQLEIGALNKEGSVEMLRVLTADAEKAISEKSAERLIAGVLKALGGDKKADGLHPLRLRLLSHVIRDAKEKEGDKTVDWIVRELDSEDVSRSEAGRVLVDGILIRRILDHVQDYRIRALADPGLVVRRITPQVIQEVMARGTEAPEDKPAPQSSQAFTDSLDFEPWEVSEAEANRLFELFGREVTLVEDHATWLKHRADVRQEMFGLIRARRGNRFRRLHELAYAFYRRALERGHISDADRAELIYHALWLGEPLGADDSRIGLGLIDSYWPEGFDPRIDVEDFDERFAQTRAYLAAKSGARLTVEQIGLLPRSIALQWFNGRRDYLLEDSDDSYMVGSTRAVMGQDFERLDERSDVAADVVRLLIRTGEWRDAIKLALRHVPEVSDYEAWSEMDVGLADPVSRASLVRSVIAIAAKSGANSNDLVMLLDATRAVEDEQGALEAFSYLYLAFAGKGPLDRIDQPGVSSYTNLTRTSRLASLTRPEDLGEWLMAYCAFAQQLPRDLACAPAILKVFKAAFGHTATYGPFKTVAAATKDRRKYGERLEAIERLWRQDPGEVVRKLRTNAELHDAMLDIVRFDHRDWFRQLAYSFDRISAGEHAPMRKALGKLLEPWSVKDIWPDGGVPTGRGLMEYLTTRVGFVETAKALAMVRPRTLKSDKAPKEGPELRTDGDGFPTTIYDLSDALLQWHEKLGWRPAEPPRRRTSSSPRKPLPRRGKRK